MSFPRDQAFADALTAVPRGMTRALRAMREAPGRPLSLTDLAAIAGVSARTLQRQFQAFLGQSPIAAFRDIRLECARRELLRGRTGETIADIALRCGFPHFGRFSIEYRRRYGERPSETFRRQALRNCALQQGSRMVAGARERPTVAVTAIELRGVDQAIARSIAEELVTGLMRSGIAVTTSADRARYH